MKPQEPSNKQIKVYKKRKLSTYQTKKNRDDKQDKEIKMLKMKLKMAEPPVKTIYAEGVNNPENTFEGLGILWPGQGSDLSNRIGNQIKIKSLNIRYNLSVSESDDFDTFRVTIVQYVDGSKEGEYPLDALANTFVAPGSDYPVLVGFNTQSASRYRVLHDKVHNLNAAGQAQAFENLIFYPKDLVIDHIKFDSSGGGNFPGMDGGIIVLWVCSDSTASPNPKIEYTCKLNFTDS